MSEPLVWSSRVNLVCGEWALCWKCGTVRGAVDMRTPCVEQYLSECRAWSYICVTVSELQMMSTPRETRSAWRVIEWSWRVLVCRAVKWVNTYGVLWEFLWEAEAGEWCFKWRVVSGLCVSRSVDASRISVVQLWSVIAQSYCCIALIEVGQFLTTGHYTAWQVIKSSCQTTSSNLLKVLLLAKFYIDCFSLIHYVVNFVCALQTCIRYSRIIIVYMWALQY